MKKSPNKSRSKTGKTLKPLEAQFTEVAELIQRGRRRAIASVNASMIDTYWRVGEYISMKVKKRSGVQEL